MSGVASKNEIVSQITVLCLNPAVDVTYEVARLIDNQKTYATTTRYDPGGNGINVGRAFKQMDINAHTFCVIAGETGEFLQRMLTRQLDDVYYEFVDGETRINTTILEQQTNTQYHVSGIGPTISPHHLEQLLEVFVTLTDKGMAVITGSLQPNIPVELYAEVTERIRQKGGRPVVDAPVAPLRHAIAKRPFLIKANLFELESLLGKSLTSIDEIAAEARQIEQQGVDYVCVSMGGDGALLVGPDNTYLAAAPEIKIRATVGAGDSMVAGMTAAFSRNASAQEALRQGIACGTGTAMHPGTELFSADDIAELAPQIVIRTMDR